MLIAEKCECDNTAKINFDLKKKKKNKQSKFTRKIILYISGVITSSIAG